MKMGPGRMLGLLIVLIQVLHVYASCGRDTYETFQNHTSVPLDLPASTDTLYLQHNKIGNFDWFPSLPCLVTLSLAYNNLTEFPNLENVNETLGYLYLSYNAISFIAYDRLDVLGSLVQLYLKSNQLRSIPDAAGPSSTLTHLVIEYNEFTQVPALKHLSKSLLLLDLDANHLTIINGSDFDNMTSLLTLSMDYNSISLINGTFFMEKLTTLRLAANLLTEFPDFRSLPSLQVLYLQANDITCIESELLDGLTSLVELRLHANNLNYSCVPDVPGPANTLQKLYLGSNLINTFPTWQYLGQNLTVLSLPNNQIPEFTDANLDLFPELTYLDLSSNIIQDFPILTENGPRFQTLDLHDNQISELNLDHLRPLGHCGSLNVGYNQLEEIPRICLADFEPTFTMTLSYNPVQCDLRLLWALWASTQPAAAFTLDIAYLTCAGPMQRASQLVNTVRLDTLEDRLRGNILVREYKPIASPFRCHMPLVSIEEAPSQIHCGVLCSLLEGCIMYGFNTSQPQDLNPPGLCALTTFYGTPMNTSVTFDWFAPIC